MGGKKTEEEDDDERNTTAALVVRSRSDKSSGEVRTQALPCSRRKKEKKREKGRNDWQDVLL